MAVAQPRATTAALPPGPGEPALVQAWRYARHFPAFTREQHARYGASYTLRLPGLGPAVVTADRELIREVLTGDPLVRRHANDILAPVLGLGSVLLLEPAPHLARRKLLLPPFHGERIAGYRRLMGELIDAELDGWHGEVGVQERARAVTLTVIQHAVLGAPDAGMARELSPILDRLGSPLASFGMLAPTLWHRSRLNLIAKPFHRLVDDLNALVLRQVTATRADPSLPDRTDVLALIVRATDEEGRGLDDDALVDEVKTLLIAGHETTATAISWGVDLLAHHPAVAARLRDASAAGDAAYLTAAAKEVLRARPVAPVSVARTLHEPTRGLPAGTVVLADAFTLHEDPELHAQPEAFRPERFLDGEPPPYSYLPFGGGAHRCLGAALAMLELALGAVTARFDLRPAGPPEAPVRRGVTLVPARGGRVVVRAA